MIVHTAVRTKVPLKKKVRGERSKSKSNHAKPVHTTVTATSGGGTITQPILTSAATTMPTSSKELGHSQSQATVIKMIQRQTSNGGKSDSPKKLLRKKKRVSAPVGAEEQQNQQTPVFKSRKLKKSKSKHKEVIHYSNRSESGGATNHTNTFGKVHKWLLESPIVSNATSQFEHASKIRKIMSKSQSTPEHLTQQLQQQRSPKKFTPAVAAKIKTKSVGNINEKVKLQVVYKPPFKFSLKLSKNDQNVKTNVLGRNKPPRKLNRIIDKKRVAAVVTATNSSIPDEQLQQLQQKPVNSVSAQFSRMNSGKRTAMLVRSVPEDNSEPNYETLNPKMMPNNKINANVIDAPDYENVDRNNTPPKINTQTFRINKSASGSNINKKIPNSSVAIHSNTNSRDRRSSISHSNSNSNSLNNRQHYNSGSQQFGGSQQSLLRSSTTNLTNNKHSNRRSNSNSNLNNRRDNSSINLLLNNGDESLQPSSSRSRKNSISSVKNKSSISRTNSNSNLSSSNHSTMRRGSISNIPRASLSINFKRQTSLNTSNNASVSNSNRTDIPPVPLRPHTSSCDNNKDSRHFEWPMKKLDKRDDPLPSDLEVMVSDVENLVNDEIR